MEQYKNFNEYLDNSIPGYSRNKNLNKQKDIQEKNINNGNNQLEELRIKLQTKEGRQMIQQLAKEIFPKDLKKTEKEVIQRNLSQEIENYLNNEMIPTYSRTVNIAKERTTNEDNISPKFKKQINRVE